MARLALALFLVFFPMVLKPSKTSGIAGVGTGASTGTQAQLTALRAESFFTWGACQGREGFSTECIPMAWGAYSEWELNAVKAWLATHPTSYVLLLNEPNVAAQGNLFCLDAGKSVEKYAQMIYADYPNAKLVVGGLLAMDDWGYSAEHAISYAECMQRAIWPDTAGRIAGWAWHYYPVWEPITVEEMQDAVNQMCDWTRAQGKECWLTEWGLIGGAVNIPNRESYIRDSLAWLTTVPPDGKAPVERSYYFALRPEPCGPNCDPGALYLYDDQGNMTEWGEYFMGRN